MVWDLWHQQSLRRLWVHFFGMLSSRLVVAAEFTSNGNLCDWFYSAEIAYLVRGEQLSFVLEGRFPPKWKKVFRFNTAAAFDSSKLVIDKKPTKFHTPVRQILYMLEDSDYDSDSTIED
jgi:hypothetical protein